jgi:hypothetical protein
MSDRCEPPEHLRGVDGWHYVAMYGFERPLWWSATEPDHTPAWINPGGVGRVELDKAARWGWRYLAPVAPPDLVRELVEALEELVDVQVFATGWDNGVTDSTGTVNEGDYFHSQSMDRARAALRRAKEAGV